jgi:Tfp pilus assembly protein PilN
MALKDINLLDPEALGRRLMMRHLGFWMGCLMAVLVTVGAVHLQIGALLSHQKNKAILRGDQTQLASTMAELKRLHGDVETQNQQFAAARSIIGGPPYAKVLERLADRLNASTWLTQLTIEHGKPGEPQVAMNITGFACSHDDLGEFLNQLSQERLFRGVTLRSSRGAETQPQAYLCGTAAKLIQFQIDCQIPRG